MKRIKLSDSKYALVDNEDFEYLNQWKWSLGVVGYAVRKTSLKQDGFVKGIYMHRLINKTPRGMDTDHINRDKLDNRKSNLRTASRSQNMTNTGPRRDNKTGYKCISWNNRIKKYEVQLRRNNKRVFSRCYTTLNEAISAYQLAEEAHNV